MPLRMTDHVRLRMIQRGITSEQIQYALNHSIRERPGQGSSIWVFGHVPGGRILKVCLSAYDRSEVLTAAWPD